MLDRAVDGPSFKGQFGWERIGTGTPELAVPVIVRTNGIRYSPVKIVEQEIIKKYDSLPQSVFQCITLKSFYLTAMEVKLLNDINYNHCNNRYGETFFSVKDVIISANDVKELSRYLNISLEISSKDILGVGPHLGIIQIMPLTNDPNLRPLLVPFITKVRNDQITRFVPYKVVEHLVKTSPTSIQCPPNDWDIMYLKMLSSYCNQDLHHQITKENQLILLDSLNYRGTNIPLKYLDCGRANLRDHNNIHQGRI